MATRRVCGQSVLPETIHEQNKAVDWREEKDVLKAGPSKMVWEAEVAPRGALYLSLHRAMLEPCRA